MSYEFFEAIKGRRSVREFTDDPVSRLDLTQLVEAGIWAPSVQNSQPWRFVLVQEQSLISLVAECTIYRTIVTSSKALIGVYLDQQAVPDEKLAQQSVGAVIQNMLLAAEELGLGIVWLGQMLDAADKINAELGISDRYELAALLAIGYPAHRNQKSHRKTVNDFIIKHFGG